MTFERFKETLWKHLEKEPKLTIAKAAYDWGKDDAEVHGDLPVVISKIKRLCFVCDKRLDSVCGSYFVEVGGCCVWVEWKGTKYLIPRRAHYYCQQKNKLETYKLRVSEANAKKLARRTR